MENLNQQDRERKRSDQAEAILSYLGDLSLYRNSVQEVTDVLFFMCRKGSERLLVMASSNADNRFKDFEGEQVSAGKYTCIVCKLTHKNAEAIRSRFDFTRPKLIGKQNSYGFGDRLGNAGPAHLKALSKTDFKPILAQQSIRELERTNRTAQEVLDAASWAVFQEGYRDGFGADGDHLKTTDDIDLMVSSGYTMFTIDPSEYVVNEAKSMSDVELQNHFENLPWNELKDHSGDFLNRMLETKIKLKNGVELSPAREEIIIGMVKYGRVITHTKKLADYLQKTYPDHPAELELSVDETDEPTTLFEHFLIASELHRLGVELVSLAPRFCGDFEKGIDFKGDLDQFRDEYIQHLTIAEKFGGYKLSIHSGSDKFSVYEVIGSIDAGSVHVKTAGTSYLEALRTIAEVNPPLFRKILDYSGNRFGADKKTYHISADLEKVPRTDSLKDSELQELLNDDHARQVLHVTYGSVLSGSDEEAASFKKRLMKTLSEYEETYEKNLIRHFDKHLNPFNQTNK